MAEFGAGMMELHKDVTRLTAEIKNLYDLLGELKVEAERLGTEMAEQRKYADGVFVRKEVFRFLINILGGGILIAFGVMGTLLTVFLGG